MKYYVIEKGTLLIADNAQALSKFYSNVKPLPNDYVEGKYLVVAHEQKIEVTDYDENGEVIGTHTEIVITYELELNPDFEAEQAQKEAERIAMLNLTAADVERGIYKAKGMDFDDIVSLVQTYPQEGLDVKALKIELKANHFYRGNPYVNAIGALLGFTSEQLDKFFEDGNYEHLLVKTDEEFPTNEIVLPEEPIEGE